MTSIKTRNQLPIVSFFDFDYSNIVNTHYRNDATETESNFNPAFSSSCKTGYSPCSDPYTWRRPEEPEDCSRGEIKRAYRLGEGF
ncbi:MAG: hypothetical protein PHQ11_04655 [Paludibacter sp.]|nr:hypothetical protein [Paludibacter sp.]